jgi:hypothetical protein
MKEALRIILFLNPSPGHPFPWVAWRGAGGEG